MERIRRPVRMAVLLALAVSAPAAASPPADPFRIGFLGPLSGPLAEAGKESLAGVEHAVKARGSEMGFGGKKRTVEVLSRDDGDTAAGALAALEQLAKERVDAIVVASSSRTVDAVVARAREGKTPLLVAGSAAPDPDPDGPVVLLVPSTVDQAMALANALALRTRKPAVGVTADCGKPGLAVEDDPHFLRLADALERNLGAAQAPAGRVKVSPGGKPDPEALRALRAAGCDRLVLLGEPELADAVADGCVALGWKVPVLAAPSVLSGAAASFRDGRWKEGTLLAALPQVVMNPPNPLLKAHAAAAGEAPLLPRTVVGFLAATLLLDGAEEAKRPREAELLAAIRDLKYGADEARMPLVDEAGRAALYRFPPWTVGPKGPEPRNPKYLPLETAGPLLGMGQRTDRVPPTPGKVVWYSFDDAKSTHPRSIEDDLEVLGLHSRESGPEVTRAVLDEILLRTVGKMNMLFLKEYDGTAVPGVSWDISFTAVEPEGLEKNRLWRAVVSGTGPPGIHGASHNKGQGTIHLNSSWLVRNLPALSRGRVSPPVGPADLPYLRGEYPWAESVEGNDRADRIRGMIDALAGAFATRSAKEVGLMAGLSLDKGPDIRSVMNTDGGEGLRETNLHFTPKDVKLLDRVFGRVGGK